MELESYNKETRKITLTTSVDELQDLIMYLGHGRHAKGLDTLNYENLGWKESAEIARKVRDAIQSKMTNLNDILLEIGDNI